MICNTDKIHPSTCAATCNAYYQCGTDKAPQSYLQTQTPSDSPSYNGPPKSINTNPNGSGGVASNTTQSSDANLIQIKPLYYFITFTSAALFNW